MAVLAGIQHERATDPRVAELISSVEGSPLVADPLSVEAVNVRELRRSYDRRVLLPRALVEELARTTSMAQGEWVAARAANEFARFLPWLEQILSLKRQESACLAADAVASSRAESVYDPLLDEYEPGAKTAQLATLFASLRNELVLLIGVITEAQERRARSHSDKGAAFRAEAILKRNFPIERQRIFGETVAAAGGFDFERGRLDVTAHPFCSGIGPGDCRITTRFDEHHFADAFFSILHEVGHGLYEQGLDQAHYGTPMGEAVSLGVHESQSRLWENAVGRSRPFWRFWLPIAQGVFHESLADVSLDRFCAAVNHVAPSLIRVQADEATYNLHIIVRFELEQELLTGELPPAELPEAWRRKYRETLGIEPTTDAEGCLQDIHWSAGLIGYFPTYTLGNLYAAQLFAAARRDLGSLDDAFAQGDFGGLLGWLRARLHIEGQRYRSAALIERITGNPPDHRPLIASLAQKYQELHASA
jgi:carboxypeptidase Taq